MNYVHLLPYWTPREDWPLLFESLSSKADCLIMDVWCPSGFVYPATVGEPMPLQDGLSYVEGLAVLAREHGITLIPRFEASWALLRALNDPLPDDLNAFLAVGQPGEWPNFMDPAINPYVMQYVEDFCSWYDSRPDLHDVIVGSGTGDTFRMTDSLYNYRLPEWNAEILNGLLRQIAARAAASGLTLFSACSWSQSSNARSYRDPATLLLDGTWQKVKCVGYPYPIAQLYPWVPPDTSLRLPEMLGWVPEAVRDRVGFGVGTDQASYPHYTVTPEHVAAEIAAAQQAAIEHGFSSDLMIFTWGRGSSGNPNRMPPEMVAVIPERKGDEIVTVISNLEAVAVALEARAAAELANAQEMADDLIAQAAAIRATFPTLQSYDALADVVLAEAQEAVQAAQEAVDAAQASADALG